MVSESAYRGDDQADPCERTRIVGPLLIAVAGVGMLWWTWRAWPDPLVDFGRELYVPWRLAEGDALFTDIAWFNGPLSQHWNALLFRLFGPGLSVLIWSNAAVLAASIAMLYRLTLRVSDRLAATVACLVFVLVFAFGQYVGIANHNWMTPYSHEVTHGVALALAALARVARWYRTRSLLALALGGIALGLCFLTKVEPFVAGSLGCAVLLTSAARDREQRAVATFGAATIVPVAISAALVGMIGTLGAWPSLLNTEVAGLPFYRAGMGLDHPAERAVEMFTWAGIWLLVLLPILAIARWSGRTRGPLVPLMTAATVLLALGVVGEGVRWPDVIRPLPLVGLAILGGLLIAARRTGRETDHTVALALTVFALALLGKMILNVRVAHYGFALAMPATLLSITALVGWLPEWLHARGARGDVLRAGAVAVVAMFALQHVSLTADRLSQKTVVVGSGRDAFRSDLQGAYVEEAVTRFTTSGAGSLAVLPEGVMINYLARAPNPTPYINFMPPEEILFGDAAWTEAFQRAPPDVILIVPKDTSEYGRGPFGTGYATSLAAWVAAGYTPREAIRFEGIAFEILTLVRYSTTP